MLNYVAKPASIGRKQWVVVPNPTHADPDPKFAHVCCTEREAVLEAARLNAIEAEIARRQEMQ